MGSNSYIIPGNRAIKYLADEVHEYTFVEFPTDWARTLLLCCYHNALHLLPENASHFGLEILENATFTFLGLISRLLFVNY